MTGEIIAGARNNMFTPILIEWWSNNDSQDIQTFIMLDEIVNHLYTSSFIFEGVYGMKSLEKIYGVRRWKYRKIIGIKNEKFERISDCVNDSIENLHIYLNMSTN